MREAEVCGQFHLPSIDKVLDPLSADVHRFGGFCYVVSLQEVEGERLPLACGQPVDRSEDLLGRDLVSGRPGVAEFLQVHVVENHCSLLF